MQTIILILLIILIIIGVVNIVVLLTKKTTVNGGQDLMKLGTAITRIEPAIREEFSISRNENQNAFKSNREELNNSFKLLSESLTKTVIDLSNAQKNQFDSYSARLSELTKSFDEKTKVLSEQLEKSAKDNRVEQVNSLKSFEDTFSKNVKDFNELQKQKFDDLANKQENIKKETEHKLKEIRETVEGKLNSIQEDNNKKLEEMRKTVDEKLQESVEKRFNESFKLITERLEAVHKGLGEMQTLATGVGDLKKVLTNVKTRGTFGEVQLGVILEQFLSPQQYIKNDHPDEENDRRVVEYSIKLPGKDTDEPVLLPIDSKFPIEDYQRLLDAYDNNTDAVEAISIQLGKTVEKCAKDISDKYIKPPKTTDFAILFVPTEGLYAEILRRPGFSENIQQKYRVMIAGPTNLAALLNSLQMGFRTLEVQKRSSEVWKILGAVKAQFDKFGTLLGKTKKKLQETVNVIDDAEKKSRTIEGKLRNVESLSEEQSIKILGETMEIGEDDIVDYIEDESDTLNNLND
ncbi:MAG: DNA recombination protein RmuC [Prevotellaceae bacterium]|jgi:DNA recombination protein RmuC|nr:DNA recombination protein RmuC [Prevotellaceae bacterium]